MMFRGNYKLPTTHNPLPIPAGVICDIGNFPIFFKPQDVVFYFNRKIDSIRDPDPYSFKQLNCRIASFRDN